MIARESKVESPSKKVDSIKNIKLSRGYMNNKVPPYIPADGDYKNALAVIQFQVDRLTYEIEAGGLSGPSKSEAIRQGEVLTQAASVLTGLSLDMPQSHFPFSQDEIDQSVERRKAVLRYIAVRDRI